MNPIFFWIRSKKFHLDKRNSSSQKSSNSVPFDSIPPRSNLAAGSTEASNEVTQTKMLLLKKKSLSVSGKIHFVTKTEPVSFGKKETFLLPAHSVKKNKEGENGAIKPDLARCTENKAMAHQQRTVGKSFSTILQKASPMFNPE